MQRDPDNLRYFNDEIRRLRTSDRASESSFDGGGGGGYDHPMEARVKKLEDDLSAMKSDVAVIRSNYATKEDMAKLGVAMHAEINAQTWKLVTFVCGFGTALVAATYFIAGHIGK